MPFAKIDLEALGLPSVRSGLNTPINRTGRPSIYSNQLADEICRMISEGSNLLSICSLEGMPDRDTVYSWISLNKEFSDKYLRARDNRADSRNDRIDDYKVKMIDGTIDYNIARVAIMAEQWQAARESPKKYGERQIVQGDKDADPIQHSLAGRLDSASKALARPEPITIEARVIPQLPKTDSSEEPL